MWLVQFEKEGCTILSYVLPERVSRMLSDCVIISPVLYTDSTRMGVTQLSFCYSNFESLLNIIFGSVSLFYGSKFQVRTEKMLNSSIYFFVSARIYCRSMDRNRIAYLYDVKKRYTQNDVIHSTKNDWLVDLII